MPWHSPIPPARRDDDDVTTADRLDVAVADAWGAPLVTVHRVVSEALRHGELDDDLTAIAVRSLRD
jgi:hypothetical protein